MWGLPMCLKKKNKQNKSDGRRLTRLQEVDLLFSPTIPSAVVPALPFVFLTQELHVFSAVALEQAQLPAELQVTKRFFSPDVEALKQEFLEVKDLGQGTVSEWLKGLAGRGNSMQHDATKWEKWESSGGTAKMRSLLYPGYVRVPPASLVPTPSTNAPSASLPNPAPSAASRQGRLERTAEEVAELKAARKAEIERRAMLLEPPLPADVLRHIPSFQAATHIVAPLDDHAWELLVPRLLAQRADAERARESERIKEAKAKEERREQRQLETTLATTKEARDRIDKAWEEVQAPLRAKIAGYADDAIRDWTQRKKVTRENCSRFAVETLLHVRKRFYAEVAKDAAAAKAAGRAPPTDPPEGPFTQKLTLENMKWIFDTKIKPRTECFRKEIFYCNGCEGNFKTFGFEGVIQHYAAKHTNALSLGNVVVHWRAEWPEHPPFSAEARPSKASFYPHGPGGFPINGGPPPPPPPPPLAAYPYPPPAGVHAPPPPPPPAYPLDMGYGYGAPTYSDYYQHPPPPPPPQPYQPPPPAAPAFTPQPSYEPPPSYAAPNPAYPSYQAPAAPYIPPAIESAQGYPPPQGGQHDHHYASYHANPSGPYGPPQPPAYPDLHQAKLDDIAHNSREVWRLLGDITDLPGSVRVFVTIHHLVKRFRSRFFETPPLSLFIDGLSNHRDMRPVRNVNGLVCKACHLGLGNAPSVERERKYFSLPQLANHFQTKHVEPMQGMQMRNVDAPLDWVVDMVLLPHAADISRLAASVNETQRSLLAAAFPSLFDPHSTPVAGRYYPELHDRRRDAAPGGEHPPAAERNHGPSQASNANSGGPGVADKHPAARTPAGASYAVDYRNSDKSHSGTPATVSEHDQPARNEASRHSSQGFRPGGGQNGSQNHKRTSDKSKRGKAHDGGLSDGAVGKRFKAGNEMLQREEIDARPMRATHPIETPPPRSSSARAERPGTTGILRAPESTRSIDQPSQHLAASSTPHENWPVTRVAEQHETDITTAMEPRLELQRSPRARSQHPAPDSTRYANSHASSVVPGPERVPGPATYSRPRYGEEENLPGSPVWASGYHVPRPISNEERNPPERRPQAVHYSSSKQVERYEDTYGSRRAQVDFIEPLPPRAEEGRFGWSAPRSGDREYDAVTPGAEYYRYHGRANVHSRPPVDAYEIVHVIDEHGEYYIRRPVRREPDVRYVYEERRVHRDAGPYAAAEPAYVPVSRQGVIRDGPGARPSATPETWRADRRADPAYYEEYDPRFPAA